MNIDNISTILENNIQEEIESNYIYKINKDGSPYKGQLEKFRLVNRPTKFDNGKESINVKQSILIFVNDIDETKRFKQQSKFLNRHLDEILLLAGSSRCVYDFLFNDETLDTLYYKLFNTLLFLFARDYKYSQPDKSIKMENIYDNIKESDVTLIISKLSGMISACLFNIKSNTDK